MSKFSQFILGLISGALVSTIFIASWETFLGIVRGDEISDARTLLFSVFTAVFFNLIIQTKYAQSFKTKEINILISSKAFLGGGYLSALGTLYTYTYFQGVLNLKMFIDVFNYFKLLTA